MIHRAFSIGCSIHKISDFLMILKKYSIKAVVDVRSVPFSKQTPQFNSHSLEIDLKEAGIFYLPFAEEFGARRLEPDAYSNDQVDFNKVISLPAFKKGINRISEGLNKDLIIAIMCTEKDPLNCHRFHLVTKEIKKQLGVDFFHIDFEGNYETDSQLEERMKCSLNISPTFDIITKVHDDVVAAISNGCSNKSVEELTKDMLNEFIINEAYSIYAKRVAYTKDSGELSFD